MKERHRTQIKVRYAETDKMGVVYYANYLVYAEAARTEFIRDMGLAYSKLEDEHGFFLPVKEAHVNYRSFAYYEDRLAVLCEVKELSKASMKIVFEIINEETNKLIADGYTLHPFVNSEGKVRRADKEIMKIFNKGVIEDEHSE